MATDGTIPDSAFGFWRQAAARALKGAALETLIRPTLDGVTIEPLYAAASAPARNAPLVRARNEAGWDVRAPVAAADPPAANRLALEALGGGCTSLLLRVGEGGLGSQADLAGALEGVVLEAAPAALDAGFLGALAADWLAEIAKDAPSARLALHLDPLSAFAEAGACDGPIEAHVSRAAEAAARIARPYPQASLFLASGRVVHESGGSAAQELGVMAAAAVSYAKALTEAGLPTEDALGRLVLGLAADADYLLGVAKLRAAREIFARLAAACGVEARVPIEARSSRRMLTALDPWTNLLRLTTAGFAAAAGGADVIVLGAFSDALGHPAERARRLARNTQLILMQESGLGRVEDPAAGAFAFEALTDQLARRGWEFFQAIEVKGGLAAALSSGFIAGEVEEVRRERERAVTEDGAAVLGVTRFPDPAPTPVELEPVPHSARSAAPPDVRLPGPDSLCAPLRPWRIAATAEAVAEDLQP